MSATSSNESTGKHIVIIGGGFAGTATALKLEKTFRRDPSVEITLIDSENFFTFTPLLAEVPSGSIQPNHIVVPLRALLKRTKVKQAEVKSVDLKNRTVIAAHCDFCGNESLPFDQLVLAPGSVSNYFGLPGVAEHALTIKSLADATALHAHVIDKLEHADLQGDPDVRRQLLTFIVAGGAFAGVETLAELNDFVRGATKFYLNVSPEDVRMVLIHSGSRILPEVSESLSAYALEKLRSRGVEVLLETRVLGSTGDSVRLSGGQELHADTLVWAAGTAPSPILGRLDLPRTKSGKIEVDATMAVSGHPGVWAVGDSAAIPDVVTGGLCPPTAQYALRQGKRLAQNIAAVLEGPGSGTVQVQGPRSSRRSGPAQCGGGDSRFQVFRLRRLVALADDLPDEIARLRAQIAGGDRLDPRSVFPARHCLFEASAHLTPPGPSKIRRICAARLR